MKRTRTAGVREAKAHLSEYLRRVEEGETVLITDRGRVVAELAPPGRARPGAADREERQLADLLLGQGVRAPLGVAKKGRPLFKWKGLGKPAGTASRTLDQLREDQ